MSGSALKLARNNLFHTKTMSPLAVTYNDKSVLENMHVASHGQGDTGISGISGMVELGFS